MEEHKMTTWPFGYFRRILLLILISLINYVSPDALGSEIDTQSSPLLSPILGQSGQLDSYAYNVSITHLSPNSVEVLWNCRGQNSHDKYEVTLKPLEASYRVIETVPYNICFIKLERLDPNTSYQVSVAAISGRVRKRSSSVIFKTYMEDLDYGENIEGDGDPYSPSIATATSPTSSVGNKDRLHLPRVRLVEISLVGMALVLWAGAIVLFFHRWGKIRMLLPYQPDYKEMKRSNSVCVNCSMTPHHQCCRVHQLGYSGADFVGPLVVGGPVTMSLGPTKAEPNVTFVSDKSCSPISCSPIRPRLNSFIVYDINNCRKDHSHGPCRKSKSAEHLEQREHSRSHTPLTQEHEAPPDDVTLADAVAADVAATDF